MVVNNIYQKIDNQGLMNWNKLYTFILPEYWCDFLCKTNNIIFIEMVINNKHLHKPSIYYKYMLKLVKNGNSLKQLKDMGTDNETLIMITCNIAKPKIIKECIDIIIDSGGNPFLLISHACYGNNYELIYQFGKYYNNISDCYIFDCKIDRRKESYKNKKNRECYELHVIKYILYMKHNNNIIADILQRSKYTIGTEVMIYAIEHKNTRCFWVL
jgi:hypothetical protein